MAHDALIDEFLTRRTLGDNSTGSPMRYSMIFVAVATFVAPPVLATPSAPPVAQSQKVDPATLAAAERVLTAMGYDRMMQRTCDAMVGQMGPMFRTAIEDKTGEHVDDALIKKLTDIESDFLHKILQESPDLRRAIALMYAKEFTAAELNHLVELYGDPVMRKWTETAPDMTAEMFPLIHGITETHRGEIEEKIKTAVVDYYAAKKQKPES
jgi:hypothetical protein